MALFGFVFRGIIFYEELSLRYNLLLTLGSLVLITLLWAFFDRLNAYLNKHLLYEDNIVKRLFMQIGVGLFFSYVFINTIFYLNIYFYKFIELSKIFIVAGNLIWTLLVLSINGFFIGEYFFIKWKQALMQNIEAEKILAQMQFANLQNQLNPHFLFNSLTTLNSLIYENQGKASNFLKQLAAMYRYLMRHNQDALVSVQEELTFIQQYLSLLNTRFGDLFRYEISIAPQFVQRKIVPITLQILIENVVKHNQMSEESPLFVHIYIENSFICVKNEKNLKKGFATSDKIGLQNLKKLYQAIAPNQTLFVIDEAKTFIVKVPLL